MTVLLPPDPCFSTCYYRRRLTASSACQQLSGGGVQDEKHLMHDEDNERDNLYARAEEISAELGNMTLELKTCINNVNSRVGNQGEASDPLSKIVHILNNQLQALSNVDDASEQVARRLEQMTGKCAVSVGKCYTSRGLLFCDVCCLQHHSQGQSAQSAPANTWMQGQKHDTHGANHIATHLHVTCWLLCNTPS